MEVNFLVDRNKPLTFVESNSSFRVDFDDRFSAALNLNLSSAPKTGPLRKGLVLTKDGGEIAGEGMGFGVPVAEYSDHIYFPMNAELLPLPALGGVEKKFSMNGIELVKVGNRVVGKGAGWLGRIYRSFTFSRGPIIKFNLIAKKLVNHKSEFVTVKGKGEISSTFRAFADRVAISCDLTKLDRTACRKIFILNEQGSVFFRKYEDSDGARLMDQEIGAWEMVKADKACLSDRESSFGFCLEKRDDAILWRGRETHEDLSWAGLIYEISPDVDYFDYEIYIQRGGL